MMKQLGFAAAKYAAKKRRTRREGVPDASTMRSCHHLPERHQLTCSMLDQVNAHLSERGLLGRSRGGKQWHVGMKVHFGADAGSRMLHRVRAKPAARAPTSLR